MASHLVQQVDLIALVAGYHRDRELVVSDLTTIISLGYLDTKFDIFSLREIKCHSTEDKSSYIYTSRLSDHCKGCFEVCQQMVGRVCMRAMSGQ